MRISVSGTRDIIPLDYEIIKLQISNLLSEHPEELLFGGARGQTQSLWRRPIQNEAKNALQS